MVFVIDHSYSHSSKSSNKNSKFLFLPSYYFSKSYMFTTLFYYLLEGYSSYFGY